MHQQFLIREGTMSEDVREIVRERYGQAALRVIDGQEKGSCCGTGSACCSDSSGDPITRDLYDAVTTAELPEAAVLASLGCGNPTALAELKAGEVVLDLGSGGGIDVLLSAKRVGPSGKAYGLDMTDEMLGLARQNAAEVGAQRRIPEGAHRGDPAAGQQRGRDHLELRDQSVG
jgi:SAM-dependent methyltransferase